MESKKQYGVQGSCDMFLLISLRSQFLVGCAVPWSQPIPKSICTQLLDLVHLKPIFIVFIAENIELLPIPHDWYKVDFRVHHASRRCWGVIPPVNSHGKPFFYTCKADRYAYNTLVYYCSSCAGLCDCNKCLYLTQSTFWHESDSESEYYARSSDEELTSDYYPTDSDSPP